ncbi:MAG: hypothetical protein BJ554DRAFT_5541, partial [Olpidium bornovanus]
GRQGTRRAVVREKEEGGAGGEGRGRREGRPQLKLLRIESRQSDGCKVRVYIRARPRPSKRSSPFPLLYDASPVFVEKQTNQKKRKKEFFFSTTDTMCAHAPVKKFPRQRQGH